MRGTWVCQYSNELRRTLEEFSGVCERLLRSTFSQAVGERSRAWERNWTRLCSQVSDTRSHLLSTPDGNETKVIHRVSVIKHLWFRTGTQTPLARCRVEYYHKHPLFPLSAAPSSTSPTPAFPGTLPHLPIDATKRVAGTARGGVSVHVCTRQVDGSFWSGRSALSDPATRHAHREGFWVMLWDWKQTLFRGSGVCTDSFVCVCSVQGIQYYM